MFDAAHLELIPTGLASFVPVPHSARAAAHTVPHLEGTFMASSSHNLGKDGHQRLDLSRRRQQQGAKHLATESALALTSFWIRQLIFYHLFRQAKIEIFEVSILN